MARRVKGGARTKSGKAFFGVAILPELKEKMDKYLSEVGMSRNSFIAMAISDTLATIKFREDLRKEILARQAMEEG